MRVGVWLKMNLFRMKAIDALPELRSWEIDQSMIAYGPFYFYDGRYRGLNTLDRIVVQRGAKLVEIKAWDDFYNASERDAELSRKRQIEQAAIQDSLKLIPKQTDWREPEIKNGYVPGSWVS